MDDQVHGLALIRPTLNSCVTQTPKLFNGKPLTGPLIATLLPLLAAEMNSKQGQILPRSLFEQMETRRADTVQEEQVGHCTTSHWPCTLYTCIYAYDIPPFTTVLSSTPLHCILCCRESC